MSLWKTDPPPTHELIEVLFEKGKTKVLTCFDVYESQATHWSGNKYEPPKLKKAWKNVNGSPFHMTSKYLAWRPLTPELEFSIKAGLVT